MGLPTPTNEDLDELYTWLDEIPLSRPKKNIARDFQDGVMAAEVLSNSDCTSFFPLYGGTSQLYKFKFIKVKNIQLDYS